MPHVGPGGLTMLNSHFKPLIDISLPYKGRQLYMHSFNIDNPTMLEGFEDYYDTVISLLKASGRSQGVAHMTVDEKIIPAGMSQRRPKPHVDGHYTGTHWGHGGWGHCQELPRMAVIVASSVAGCKAWEGQFEAQPKNDGDLTHIEHELGTGVILPPNVGYLLSPDCIHESMIFNEPIQRTFLRIALPVQ
jgi:hypothetical protein